MPAQAPPSASEPMRSPCDGDEHYLAHWNEDSWPFVRTQAPADIIKKRYDGGAITVASRRPQGTARVAGGIRKSSATDDIARTPTGSADSSAKK